MTTHRLPDGSWEACTDVACELPFHTALSVTEAIALPLELLLPLCNAAQPPQVDAPDGMRMWVEADPAQRAPLLFHRAYDLPAVIDPEGNMEWWWHGDLHREHDLPAQVRADGTRVWFRMGKLHRTGAPAVMRADGTVEWWEAGQRQDGRNQP